MKFNTDLLNVENNSLISDELAARFLSTAMQFVAFGAQAGFNIIATTDEGLPSFRALSLPEQFKALKKLEQSCEIYMNLIREKRDVRSSFSLVWMACGRFGLRPPSDFFDKLTDDDVIQVYSQEGLHRFSNFKFFEMCSYTLEQIYTVPWHLLWDRAKEDTEYLMDCAMKILDPDQRTTIVFDSPYHRIKEVSSVFRYESLYRLKCAAPLFDRATGLRNGYIVCEQAEILTKHTPLEEERLLLAFERQVVLS